MIQKMSVQYYSKAIEKTNGDIKNQFDRPISN